MPEEDKKKDADKDKIIMEAHMHCEDCRQKVYKALIGYPGIEEISIDMKAQKVKLKGDVDAKKLFEKVKKKSGYRVTKLLQFPEEKKAEPKKDEKKPEPKDVTVVLKVSIDCHACRKKVEKAIWQITAVQSMKVEGNKVTVKGKDLDPKKVCEHVENKSGKHVEVVPPKKEDDKKKEGDDKKKEGGDAKKDEKQSTKATTEYVYPPQYFSDENPNSCGIM